MGKYDDLFQSDVPKSKYQDLLDVPKSKYQDLLDVPTASQAPALDAPPQLAMTPTPGAQFQPTNSLGQSGGNLGPQEFNPLTTVGESLPRGVGLSARAAGGPALAAGIGSIVPGVGTAAGLGTYAATRLLYDPVAGIYNGVRPQTWPQAPTTSDLVTSLADELGLPKPETPGERILSTGLGAAADYGGMNSLGKILQISQSPVAKGAGDVLASSPGTQTVLSGVSGGAAETTKELGGGPIPQLIAGIAAPLLAHGGANLARSTFNAAGPANVQAAVNAPFAYAKGVVTPGETGASNVLNQTAEILAAKQLQNQVTQAGESIPNVVGRLQSAAELEGGGYNPTSGTSGGSNALLSMEKGMMLKGDLAAVPSVDAGGSPTFEKVNPAAILKNRQDANLAATQENLAKTLAPQGASPVEAQTAVARNLATDAQNAESAQIQAQKAAEAASQERQVAQDKLAASAPDKTPASQAIVESVTSDTGKLNEFKGYKNQLYDAATPQEGTVPTTKLSAKLDELHNKYLGTVSEDEIPKTLTKLKDLYPDGIPADHLETTLQKLNSDLAEAPKGSNTERMLTQTKQALLEDVSASGSPEAQKIADTFMATEYSPRFKQGAGGEVFNSKGKGGAASSVLPSDAFDKFFTKGQEGGAQLKSILQGFDSEIPAPDLANVRKATVAKMAESVGPNPTPEKISTWLSKDTNAAFVGEFPSIKTEIEDMARSLGTKAQSENKMLQYLKELSGKTSEAKQAQTFGHVAEFANSSNPASAVGDWIMSSSAPVKMEQLLAKVGNAPDAKQGILNAVRGAVLGKLKNASLSSSPTAAAELGPISSDELVTSLAKITKTMAEGTRTREALTKVLSPKELSDIDQVGRQIANSAKLSNKTFAGTSDTAGSLSSTGVLSKAKGATAELIKGVANTAMKIGLGNSPEEVINGLKLQATLDPKLAAMLLERPTWKTLPRLQAGLAPYVSALTNKNVVPDSKNQ